MKTLLEWKTEAFAILTGSAPDVTPAPEDLAAIDTYVDPLVAQLANDEIVGITNTDEIPDEYFLPLVRLLANVCGPRFGSAMNEQAKQIDEMTLRSMTRGRPTYEPMIVDHI
jgi:hypothetical protein